MRTVCGSRTRTLRLRCHFLILIAVSALFFRDKIACVQTLPAKQNYLATLLRVATQSAAAVHLPFKSNEIDEERIWETSKDFLEEVDVPGEPDFIRRWLVKAGAVQMVAAIGDGMLPDVVLEGMNDKNVSSELVNTIALFLEPYITMRTVSEGKKQHILRQTLQQLLVHKPDFLVNVMRGTVKVSPSSRSSAASSVAKLHTSRTRKGIVERLSSTSKIPKVCLRPAVDALGTLIPEHAPVGCINEAIHGGEKEREELEDYLANLVSGKMQVRLVNDKEKQKIARGTVKAWLNLVKCDLDRDYFEATKRSFALQRWRWTKLRDSVAQFTGLRWLSFNNASPLDSPDTVGTGQRRRAPKTERVLRIVLLLMFCLLRIL